MGAPNKNRKKEILHSFSKKHQANKKHNCVKAGGKDANTKRISTGGFTSEEAEAGIKK